MFPVCLLRSLINSIFSNEQARRAVVQRYAKQLKEAETSALAEASSGLSCRDLKEVCEHAERRWVAKVLNNRVASGSLILAGNFICFLLI